MNKYYIALTLTLFTVLIVLLINKHCKLNAELSQIASLEERINLLSKQETKDFNSLRTRLAETQLELINKIIKLNTLNEQFKSRLEVLGNMNNDLKTQMTLDYITNQAAIQKLNDEVILLKKQIKELENECRRHDCSCGKSKSNIQRRETGSVHSMVTAGYFGDCQLRQIQPQSRLYRQTSTKRVHRSFTR